MRIKKIIIKNYKSIKELVIEDFSELNVLIGKNDSGKSNILSVLDLIFNSNSHDLKLAETNILETKFKENVSRLFFDKNNPFSEITVFLEISKHELEKADLKSDETNDEIVISRKLLENKLVLDFLRLNKVVLVKTPDEKNRFLENNSFTDNYANFDGKRFLEQLPRRFQLIPADRNIIRSPAESSGKMKAEKYIKNSLMSLANSNDEDKNLLFEQFTDFINDISPLICKIESVKKNGIIIDLKFKNIFLQEIPLSTIGGGNNELLLLLHEIIVSGGKVLAIEEPEIHLHPEAERKLFRFMQEFSQTTQMLIVTHSSIFVQPTNLHGLLRVVKKGQNTEVYGLKHTIIDNNRLIQELNAENCEMFFADKVLLVEGISDKIMMEGLIDKYCKSAEEIKVVSSFSKDNFEVYVELLKIFKIPFIL
ncbi:hypothetical protein CMO90_02275, partial [Candidatus Woesearchaeota archaeon]|nr:hypothetical protein [Candidatus Woesearchaeota archaeon]